MVAGVEAEVAVHVCGSKQISVPSISHINIGYSAFDMI